MARATINGLEIDHELIGQAGGHPVAITPGGRFARDSKGVPELAEALAAKGYRVLLWDRPNCGASDLSFDGPSESRIQADALVGLVRQLGLGPTALLGGSAGARVTLLAAAADPGLVSHLVVWWISGGAMSLAQLAAYYTAEPAYAAARHGMEAVADLPGFAQQIARNPRNRDIILAWEREAFIAKMEEWAQAFAYSHTSPVPGIDEEGFARLDMPALVYRSGKSDMSHTRATSEWVARLLPNASLIEPPWGDQEWNDRMEGQHEPGRGLFENWPMLAPRIAEFLAEQP